MLDKYCFYYEQKPNNSRKLAAGKSKIKIFKNNIFLLIFIKHFKAILNFFKIEMLRDDAQKKPSSGHTKLLICQRHEQCSSLPQIALSYEALFIQIMSIIMSMFQKQKNC